MPHYLRMIKYASEPEDDWGPSRRENQCGRYESLRELNDSSKKSLDGSIAATANVNGGFDLGFPIISRF